jgi:D-alanine-D-alanine ligase
MAKRVVRDAGIPTPDFRIIENESDALLADLDFPLFVKPIAEGTGKGVTPESIVTTREQLISVSKTLWTKYRQPVLAETLLPGREFTVGILGSGKGAFAIGVMEVILKKEAEPGVYSYVNKEQCEELVEYRLANDREAREAAKVALDVWKAFWALDGGRIDLKSDAKGRPNFIEANPLAGLHPEHSDLCILAGKAGMTYKLLIDTIVSSAISRRNIGRMTYAGNSHRNRS